MDTPSMDKLTMIYVKIREKKKELQAKFDADIEVLDDQMKTCAGVMKDMLVAAGGTSMKTPHGTVYTTQKTKFYPMDWDVFGDWVIKQGTIDLLEKRVAQTNMKQWLEQHPTNPPPGLQAETEITVTVRKT